MGASPHQYRASELLFLIESCNAPDTSGQSSRLRLNSRCRFYRLRLRPRAPLKIYKLQARLVAAANGNPATTSPSTHQTSAQTADALFSVTSPNLNKLKIDLIRRTGEALGIKENDYATSAEYGAALRGALATINCNPTRSSKSPRSKTR
jgi:hypothetical protein